MPSSQSLAGRQGLGMGLKDRASGQQGQGPFSWSSLCSPVIGPCFQLLSPPHPADEPQRALQEGVRHSGSFLSCSSRLLLWQDQPDSQPPFPNMAPVRSTMWTALNLKSDATSWPWDAHSDHHATAWAAPCLSPTLSSP